MTLPLNVKFRKMNANDCHNDIKKFVKKQRCLIELYVVAWSFFVLSILVTDEGWLKLFSFIVFILFYVIHAIYEGWS